MSRGDHRYPSDVSFYRQDLVAAITSDFIEHTEVDYWKMWPSILLHTWFQYGGASPHYNHEVRQ
jgi:hypothetical protein